MIWVLVKDYNAYDQFGSYFVAAWTKKPGYDEIAKLCEIDTNRNNTHAVKAVNHILSGGGRMAVEDEWYTLVEVEEGEKGAGK